jgi:MFS family permease
MGQSISSLGTGISQVAFPVLIFVLTNNPAVAGLMFSVGQLPYILFSLAAGALVDRWDRKRVMIVCTAGLAVCLASVAFIVFGGFSWPVQLTLLFAFSFLIGSLSVFYGLAEVAAITRVVSRAQLAQALTQNELAYSSASLVAPPIGTVLLSVSRLLPFVADAISYGVLLVSLFFIRTSFQEERVEVKGNLLVEIREGFAWVRQLPVVLLLIVLAAYLEVIVNINVLLVPVIARNEGFPLSIVGVILAAAGIGNLLGAALNSALQRHVPLGRLLISTLLLFVVLWPLYGFVTNLWALGVVIAGLGLIDTVAYLQTASYRLAVVPDQFQGRVNSIARLIIFGFLTLGPAAVGICLQRFGVIVTVIVLWGGFIVCALLALLNVQLRQATLPKE